MSSSISFLVRTALPSFLAAAAAVSQTTQFFTVPGPAATSLPFTTNNLPFAGGPMRYQQVYKASDIATQVGPARIKGLWFRGTQGGQLGAQVTMDLRIAHAAPFVGSQFEANIGSTPLQVLSQSVITLPTSTTNWYFNIPFGTKEFIWNGVDDVIIEVKIFANSVGNQPFTHYFDSVIAAPGSVRRLYTVGNANAPTVVQDQTGTGVVTRFDYGLGVNLNFGRGCPGLGNFVPEATAAGLPLVPNPSFALLLAKARHQVHAVLLLGNSRTRYGTLTLPFDLAGVGAPNCLLLVAPIIVTPTVTTGGSAGNGAATVPLPIPAFTGFIGYQLFTQWLVVDGSQNAAGFVMSNGLLTAIGM